MNGHLDLCVLPLAALLAGCAAAPAPLNDATGDFSVVVGVPAEWVSRIDEARYLEAADCALLCPPVFVKHVTSCHLARVVGGRAAVDTAVVVCNGSAGASPR